VTRRLISVYLSRRWFQQIDLRGSCTGSRMTRSCGPTAALLTNLNEYYQMFRKKCRKSPHQTQLLLPTIKNLACLFAGSLQRFSPRPNHQLRPPRSPLSIYVGLVHLGLRREAAPRRCKSASFNTLARPRWMVMRTMPFARSVARCTKRISTRTAAGGGE
jgi:hypothetical protein